MAKKESQKYKGNGKHDWEPVYRLDVFRLRVPGGWLYKDEGTMTVTFVPMPEVVKHWV
jgi:hypothetical protein